MRRQLIQIALLISVAVVAVGILILTDANVSAQSGTAVARFFAKLVLLCGSGLLLLFVGVRFKFGQEAAYTAVYVFLISTV